MQDFQKIVKFVQEIYGTKAFIPLHEPRFRGNEKKYLNECIDSTFVSSVGKFVDLFEQKIAEYTGAKYAIAAVNGTAALHMALVLAGVEQDEEVITQPLTFIATANAISYTGAKPVFVDVDKDTMGLSPEKLKLFLEENVEIRESQSYNKKTGKRISACIPMHTFGHPCRIDKIKEICDEYHIPLIEDAAESLGSYYKNQHTGTFGLIGTLSFNGNKTITTGGGGMLITNDEAIAIKAKHLTTQAKVPHKWDYVHDFIGYNYRLTNLAAALGVAQMEQLPEIIKSKQNLAEKYKQFFENTYPELGTERSRSTGERNSTDIVKFISEPLNSVSNYWLNAVLLNNREARDQFLDYTNKNGVMTRPIWELMNRLPMFKDCQVENIENSEWLVDRVVNIPSSVI